jgi:hypothetical protein
VPNLPFQVPPKDDKGNYVFSSYSTEDLTSIRSQIREAAAQYADMEISDVSPEDVETMRELTQITKGVNAERSKRSGAAGAFAALTDSLGDEDEPDDEPDAGDAGSTEASAPAAPAATTTAAAAKPPTPGVAAVASQTAPAAVPAETVPQRTPAVILAGANNDVPMGEELDWNKVGKLVEKRFQQYSAMGGGGAAQRHSIAQFKLDYPKELVASGGLQEDATAVIDYAASEKRLPGGSLLASINLTRKRIEAQGGNSLTAAGTGWCAPSEVLYDLCELESSDGLLDIPEINVSRGGIKYTTGPDFSSIYSGAGYFHYTEAQIISGVTKPTMSVPCPSFTDTRLEADGLAIQTDLLQLRGYPELIARFVRGAMVAHTHKINQFMINALVTGSTALSLPSNVASHTPGLGTTWYSDHSVVSTLLGALDMAIQDYKYRQRMQLNSTLEIVLPYWVQSWIRADITRKAFYDGDGSDQYAVTMQRMTEWLTVRGARVQWVYDWQDAFYWAAYPTGAPSQWQQFGTDPTSSNFVQDWPHTLQILLYAAGTWVRGNADIITLDTVYDSTLLAQNKTTQLFTEQGILAAKTCFDSRVYTIGTATGGLIPDGAAAYALNAQALASTGTFAVFPSNP